MLTPCFILLLSLIALPAWSATSHSAISNINKGNIVNRTGRGLPSMPNVDYVFRGYHILKGNPLATGHRADPGFEASIFSSIYEGTPTNDGKYQIPHGVSVYNKEICTILFQSESYANEKKYWDEIKEAVGVDFNGWGDAFTGSFDFKKTQNKILNEHRSFVKTEALCGVYEVVLDIYDAAPLSTGFLKGAKTLESLDERNFKLFIETYGTHFVSSMHIGAKYAESTEFTKESKEKLELMGINLGLAAEYSAIMSLGINSDTEVNQEHLQKFESEKLNKEIISFGTKPPKDANAVNWANSVIDEPLPISYELLPISTLFSDTFMNGTGVDYERILPALDAYLENYCENEQSTLGISSCLGPIGGCLGGHDCHHNAMCQDYHQSYKCACKPGYEGNGIICSGWGIHSEISPDVFGPWGEWGKVEYCPHGTYAYAYAIKVEDDHPAVDDTALNAVKLYCKSPSWTSSGEATSTQGIEGSWKDIQKCTVGYLNGFRLNAQADIIGDDHAATDLDMYCSSGEMLHGQGTEWWGQWSSWSYCPGDAAVCGIQTKIDPYHSPWEDDTSLNNVRFFCCKF